MPFLFNSYTAKYTYNYIFVNNPPGAVEEKCAVSKHRRSDVPNDQVPLYMEKQQIVQDAR
jgi:hypothetical protein